MPKKTYSKKRTYRRRRALKKQVGVFRLQRNLPVGFPKTNCVKLRYVDSTVINPSIGAIGYHWYSANNCSDPDYSGLGHQPSGWDQWGQFYNHYVVVGAKIKATFALRATGTEVGGIMIGGINLSDDVVATSDMSTLLEQSLATKNYQFFNLSNRPKTITKGYSAKKFFNVTNITDNWARLGAQVQLTPAELAYFGVFVGCSDYSVDPPNISCLIEIEYIVVFSEPKEIPQS